MTSHAQSPVAGLTRLLPSARSIGVALGILCAGILAYGVARQSSLFAIRSIEVEGAPQAMADRARKALQPFVGRTLVSLDGAAVVRELESLPVVASASYDRGFPHTLRLALVPEQPALVLRQGPRSWLVSTHARVMKSLRQRAFPHLSRTWVPADLQVVPGALLDGDPARAVRAVLPIRGTPFAKRIRTVRVTPQGLVLALRSGLKLRLGDAHDLRLKLAVGEELAASLGHVSGYADLNVPGRPVVSIDPQVVG